MTGADNATDCLESYYTRIGTRTPRCTVEGCNETDPRALTSVYPTIVCYEHAQLARGRAWVEEDHLSGRHNDSTTAPLPGNDHRVRSEMQIVWPRETLRNPDGSPLLQAAASLRGWLDVLRLMLERTVGWIPAFLEALDAWLRTRLGGRWWKDFPGVITDGACSMCCRRAGLGHPHETITRPIIDMD